MDKTLRIIIGFFVIFLICYNINELLTTNDKLHPFNKYYANSNVIFIYITAIILDIILVNVIIWSLIIKEGFESSNKRMILVFMLVALALFLLTIFEFYHSTTFYYGEVKDKQGFPWSGINSGFVGSIILLCYSIFTLIVSKKDSRKE